MNESEKINLKDSVIYEYLHSTFIDRPSEEVYFILSLHHKIMYQLITEVILIGVLVSNRRKVVRGNKIVKYWKL